MLLNHPILPLCWPARTAAMYAANANVIGENSPTTTPSSKEDPSRMIQCDFSAVRFSDFDKFSGSTFILQADTTASQAGTTAVFANFLTDNSATTTRNQTTIIPANRGCNYQRIQNEQSNETIKV